MTAMTAFHALHPLQTSKLISPSGRSGLSQPASHFATTTLFPVSVRVSYRTRQYHRTPIPPPLGPPRRPGRNLRKPKRPFHQACHKTRVAPRPCNPKNYKISPTPSISPYTRGRCSANLAIAFALQRYHIPPSSRAIRPEDCSATGFHRRRQRQ